jgi:ferredoxin
MTVIKFIPADQVIDAIVDMKLLIAARKNKIPIRFGCAACQCGICVIKISEPTALKPMSADEENLLKTLKVSTSGDVRLACQARLSGMVDAIVDTSFQDPDGSDAGDGTG